MGNISEATIAMDFTEIVDGQRCGLACMGKINNVLGIKMEKGQKYLYTSNDTTEISTTFLNGNQIYLRVSIDMLNQKFQYFYSTDNIRFIPYGTSFFIPFGFWKGARIALYCYNKEQEAGAASFQWFKYKHDGPQIKIDNAAEQIISNIARTSFPHKKIKVICPDSASNQKGHSRQLIQRAIDSCSLAGGGHVIISKGIYYLKGNLVLKSDVNLHLEKDAYLLFSGKADDFLPEVWTRWEGTELYGHSPMIYAKHATNIAITGQGTIDAQGGREFASWSQIEVSDRNRLRKMGEKLIPVTERIFGKGTILRPSCIQFMGCSRILVEGITIKNSPFWTIHPVYCDNVIVRSITIDSHYPNNDGCDPESTSNVLIEKCIFRTGDDAIAIKAGRDADGREIGRPSKNIVIRNCLFQSECNGLCIGSEMSGGVRRVTISNCVFDGTDSGIRLKSSRGRGGVVEELRVDNIVMKNIQRNAFIFDLFYDKESKVEPVSERTPVFRNIHLSNITGSDIKQIGYIKGIEEMPVQGLSFSNINMKAEVGFIVDIAEDIRFDNVDFSSQTGSPWQFSKCKQIVLNNVRSKYPVNQQPIVTFEDVDNAIINNCFQMTPVKDFYKANNSHIIEGHNYWKKESFK